MLTPLVAADAGNSAEDYRWGIVLVYQIGVIKMRIISTLLLIVFSMLTFGCASSGPVPMGQDTFMITKQSSTGFHSGASVKADIYREAGEHCMKIGKQLQPVSDRQVDGMPGRSFANAEIVFRCLSQTDAELSRPTIKQVPNLIIENRNK